jgi:hypothetical protein
LFWQTGTVPPDTVVLKIPINRWNLLEAGRRRDGGDKAANPLGPAISERSAYVLDECWEDRLVLTHVPTGRHYAGPVPPELAEYSSRFRAGKSVQVAQTFELILVAMDD